MMQPSVCACCVSGLTSVMLLATPAVAQLSPDDTLGNEASIVTPNAAVQGDPATLIEGGAVRGSHLFHSFSDFNVETLQRVYFANPAAIETILTRVTGSNISTIDGTLGVDGLADLYLLNPNGIVFGPNARLDIRGSFVASTADEWNLGDGDVFSAVDPAAPPLLTVSLTPGLQYGATPQGDISNAGDLAVAPKESLILMGQTVTHTGTLTASGGRVQLLGDRVGVFEAGRIDVSSPTDGGMVNLGGDFQGQGTLPTAQQTVVGPEATLSADATDSGEGGDIIVWADGVTRFYGSATARGSGNGSGGLVEVSGLERLVFEGAVDTTAVNGNTGTLLLDPTNIQVVGFLNAETFSLADVDQFADPDIGGDGDSRISAPALTTATSNVVLQATETIAFESPVAMVIPSVGLSAIAGERISVNRSISTLLGDISLTAPDIDIRADMSSIGGAIALNGENQISLTGAIDVMSDGFALFNTIDAGDISINTSGTLSLTDGAQISAAAIGSGDGGNIDVVAGSVLIDGFRSDGSGGSNITANIAPGASGDGGDITLTTDTLALTNGGGIAIAHQGQGTGGDISIEASQVDFDGVALLNGTYLGPSGILSITDSGGDNGNVTIESDRLSVSTGAIILSGNLGEGDAGDIAVTTRQVELDGVPPVSGGLSGGIASLTEGSGEGGDVSVDADTFTITNGSAISTATFTGNAGALTITVDRLEVDGFSANIASTLGVSSVNSQVRGPGTGGAVTVNAANLSITNGANISTSNFGSGVSGSLTVITERGVIDGLAAIGETPLAVSAINADVLADGIGSDVVVNADTLEVRNGGRVSTFNFGDGTVGDLSVSADQLDVNGFFAIGDTTPIISSRIGSEVQSTGDGGDVNIQATTVSVTNGANITTSNLGFGASGDLTVVADQVNLDGFVDLGAVGAGTSSISSTTFFSGDGGNLSVRANGVSVNNGAVITTSNLGTGRSGDLEVIADQIDLRGGAAQNANIVGSIGIASEVLGSGPAGNVNVITDNLSVTEGASVSTRTFGQSDAGNLRIQADESIEVRSGAIASSSFSQANSGDVMIFGGDLRLSGESLISAGTFATASTSNASNAAAGQVSITAEGVFLDSSEISTTGNLGDGGNLFIQASNALILRNGSLISTTAGLLTAGGDGGNVTIDAPFIVGVLSENSDITANAFEGSGGRVEITALDIIGLEFQDQLTPFSDITASSELGAAGITEFNRLTDINVEEGLNELPVDLTDPTSLISQQCQLQASDRASEFTVVGRGGLPPDPSQPSTNDSFLEDLGTVPPEETPVSDQSRTDAPDTAHTLTAINEAQGWVQAANGQVYLVSADAESGAVALPTDVLCAPDRP